MADNTTINASTVVGGDVIATEDIVAGGLRGDPSLSAAEYKIPRSKIALGSVDADAGDVTIVNPMPVADLSTRRIAERGELSSVAKLDVNLTTRYRERLRVGDRLDLIDRRGPGGR